MSGPDPDQLEKMREAVEAKDEQVRGTPPDAAHGELEEESLHEHGRPQDVRSVRAKSSGHGKKTADKWNQ